MKLQSKQVLIVLVFTVLLAALVVRLFVASTFIVASSSMEPSLIQNEVVLARKLKSGALNPISAGDIAIIKAPNSSQLLVSRIVALGGDRVEVANGQLMINGALVQVETDSSERMKIEEFGARRYKIQQDKGDLGLLEPLVVPPQSIYFLNDNRSSRADSRSLGVGSLNDIQAIVSLRLFSVEFNQDSFKFRWERMFQAVP